ncbi:MAG: hypothetical protein LBV74_08750 [Tannerella sp.]|jgi:hypothetical protein|nr:hypothetical protein [Tannerella sp.]
MSDSNETEKKGLNAKDVTLKTMIIAALWIGVLSLIKAFWGLLSSASFGLDMKEIVMSGAVIAGVFSPVFVSIILDKVRDIKVGK